MENRITAEEFKSKIDNDADFLLLDVRKQEDHDGWPVRWIKPMEEMVIPYYDFMEDKEQSLSKVPENREIIVVCNRGNASDEIADYLSSKGVNAKSVRDGMKAWGSLYNREVIEQTEHSEIFQFNRFAKGCLSYILISGNEAAVVDAGRHIDQYVQYMQDHNLKLRYVFDTHLHADHISGGYHLAKKLNAEYYINEQDMDQAKFPYKTTSDGMKFPLGQEFIEVISLRTPGHTPGSTSYLFRDRFLMTGDILMLSSLGRPDLGGQAAAWVQDLWNTVQNLSRFSDDTVILPTHSSGIDEFDSRGRVLSTLGELRKRHHLLTIQDEKKFEDEILSSLPAQPDSYETMRMTNKGNHQPDEEEMEELELGKNQCAVEAYKESKGA